MTTETEHKYLVKGEIWKNVVPDRSIEIRQAYLLTDPDKTIRIRTKDDKGYITIKGKTIGASRAEFEYEIPITDAHELIRQFASCLIEKIRHVVMFNNKIWEVDEFRGSNEGLIVAEIELVSEEEVYTLPEWAGKNVTHDHRYANSALSIAPFTTWRSEADFKTRSMIS